jgi:hypothetical protein
VNHAVMVAADHHEVVRVGAAAVSPVSLVVRVQPPSVRAAVDHATTIACTQLPTQRCRNGARCASASDRLTVVHDGLQAAVACQSADRFHRDRHAAFEHRDAVVRSQHGRVDMRDNGCAVRIGIGPQRKRRHLDDRIGTALFPSTFSRMFRDAFDRDTERVAVGVG